MLYNYKILIFNKHMNHFEELLADALPIETHDEAAERQAVCDALRKKFRKEVMGALTFGGAETALGLYMIQNPGNMNVIDAWCLIAGHLLLTSGTMRCTTNAIRIRDRIKAILRKMQDYRDSHAEATEISVD
jgi:hypothetical protein